MVAERIRQRKLNPNPMLELPDAPGPQRRRFREDPQGMLDLGACQLQRTEGKVLKSGRRVKPAEARALKFAHSLQLPVPAIHEVVVSDDKTSILMDFVEGECLEEAWPRMDKDQKRRIAEQLRDIISTMRQAKPTQSTIGSFGGPARDLRQFHDCYGGPFDTVAEFNDFILDLTKGTPPLVWKALRGGLCR